MLLCQTEMPHKSNIVKYDDMDSNLPQTSFFAQPFQGIETLKWRTTIAAEQRKYFHDFYVPLCVGETLARGSLWNHVSFQMRPHLTYFSICPFSSVPMAFHVVGHNTK